MSTEWKSRFARCGSNVTIEPDVHIEHPELFEVDDDVTICRGFIAMGRPRVRLGQGSTLFPRCFVQGSGQLIFHGKVDMYPGGYVSTGGENGIVEVGAGTHFAVACALYGGGGLRIGELVNVAGHVLMATVQHDPRLHEGTPMAKTSESAPITIADDVWIGANASIVPGVNIATGCIVGANAVVTRDTDPYGVYVGIPARRHGDRRPAPAESTQA